MGLVFYYLFHYLLLPLLLLPPLFLLGLKVNINQQQHLCCGLLFILQSYAAALISEELLLWYSVDACGLFIEILVLALCDMLAVRSCWSQDDITQWLFRFEALFYVDLLLRVSSSFSQQSCVQQVHLNVRKRLPGNRFEYPQTTLTVELSKAPWGMMLPSSIC